MSLIVDGVLRNPDNVITLPIDLEGKPFMRYVIDYIAKHIKEHGDWDFVANADLGKYYYMKWTTNYYRRDFEVNSLTFFLFLQFFRTWPMTPWLQPRSRPLS